MKITEIRGEFRKTVSDGNYGNETYSVSFVASAPDVDAIEPAAEAADLAQMAEQIVRDRLRHSQDRAIRRAVMTDKERNDDYELEREEQRREWEEREAKRKAEREALTGAPEPEDTPF